MKISNHILMKALECKIESFIINGPSPRKQREMFMREKRMILAIGPSLK